MPYCPECGRYHTPDTGGCRFQTTIATPFTQEQGQTRVWFKPDSPLKKDARELAERITTLRQEDYQFESPMWFKVGKQLDDATAEIERFVEALLAARQPESAKTVPMEMLRDVYEYGRSGGRLGKINLCGIISRYGYTVTESAKEE